MITEVDDANDSATSKITWSKERDIALLGQIVKVGKAAFETNRGGGKFKDSNKQLTQEQIWAGPGGILDRAADRRDARSGLGFAVGGIVAKSKCALMIKRIISVLKQDYGHLFQGVKWPSTQSVINHITHKQSGLIFKFKHLYTSGMEQSEPAEAGTEGTKDERPLGEFETLLIEVAELYNEVKAEKEKAESAKDADIKKTDSRNEFMQDAACKGDFQAMSKEERTGNFAMRKAARAKRAASVVDVEDGSSSSSSRTNLAKKANLRRITVRQYMEEQYLPETDFKKIVNKEKPTPGWTLLSDEDTLLYGFDQPTLEKKMSMMDTSTSFREQVTINLNEFTETNKKKLQHMELVEKNRSAERTRELDLAEREMKLKEEKHKADAEEKKAMMELLAKLANK
ncbi:hypothetical protein AB1Y20_011667 [Prymnesium parvum]|uniref:Uncharacterized protein n=1 Tax=Prymnesium parvum TaxID=97485 RepID=A0AB34II33_PRYPA